MGGGMTRDEIIRMAREAGGSRVLNAMVFDRDEMLERFAELVAAAERERCAKVCEEIERRKWEIMRDGGKLTGVGAMDCAALIRWTK